MADLFQGSPLPSVTTTTQQQTTAPQFYTNYLQDIANIGKAGVQQGGVAGFSPLQMQAMQMAPNVAFSGAQTIGQGAQLTGAAGATPTTALIGQYMNPYTSSVVDEMGRLTQRNVQESVMPSLGAGSALTGGYGSRRQQQITGQTLRDIQSDLLGRQMGALQAGYTQAGQMAQNDLTRMLQAGQTMGSLGTEQQQIGLKGLGALSDLGAQQQALAQKQLDYPMTAAQNFAKLMQGYQIPTSVITQETGPKAGAYSASPMSQISGLLATIAALKAAGQSPATTTTDTTSQNSSDASSTASNLASAVSSAVSSALGSSASPNVTSSIASPLTTSVALNPAVTKAASKPTMSYNDYIRLSPTEQDRTRTSGVEITGWR